MLGRGCGKHVDLLLCIVSFVSVQLAMTEVSFSSPSLSPSNLVNGHHSMNPCLSGASTQDDRYLSSVDSDRKASDDDSMKANSLACVFPIHVEAF